MTKELCDECFTAPNGKEALELLVKHKEINLVLSDIKMPIMDGLQFIQKARELDIQTPFVFFTGYGSN